MNGVLRTGELLRYMVPSTSEPDAMHMVDLAQGECSCMGSQCWKRCKHMDAAMAFCKDELFTGARAIALATDTASLHDIPSDNECVACLMHAGQLRQTGFSNKKENE